MDELTQLANALMALDDKLAARMHEVSGFCHVLSHVYRDDAYRRRPHPREDRSCRKPAPSHHRRPEAVNEKLSRCLLPAARARQLPSGVKTTDIFLEARAIVASHYLGLS